MSDIQALIRAGVEMRESGDPKSALELFTRAIKESSNVAERACIMAEMALCYQHLGKLDMATTLYYAAMEDLMLNCDVTGVARIRRQLSSIQLSLGNIDEAFELALRARNAIVLSNLKPNDLCHMTHGIIKVLYAKRRKDGVIAWFKHSSLIFKLLVIESAEVKEMMRKEKSIAKNVWYTGYLADIARFFPIITFPAGLLGLFVAKNNHLGLRIVQFQKHSI